MQFDANIIAKCINAYDSSFESFDADDSYLDERFDDFDMEPTEDDLKKIMAQDKGVLTPKTDPLSLNIPKSQRATIKPTNYCFYALRKRIYEYNGEKKTPIISGDSAEVQCRHCGKTHQISEMILKGEENEHSDAIFALLNLYNFAIKCSCGKYIYGYYKEPVIPDWLTDIVEPKKKTRQKKSSSKKNNSDFPAGYQMSLFDIPELQNEEQISTNVTKTTTLKVDVANIPTLAEKLEIVANLNNELSNICDEVYANTEYAEEIASFEDYKMKALIDEAKARDGVKNFMRMLKKEIISCLVLFDHMANDEKATNLFNDLSDKVQTRTAWLYGKYKDIK